MVYRPADWVDVVHVLVFLAADRQAVPQGQKTLGKTLVDGAAPSSSGHRAEAWHHHCKPKQKLILGRTLHFSPDAFVFYCHHDCGVKDKGWKKYHLFHGWVQQKKKKKHRDIIIRLTTRSIYHYTLKQDENCLMKHNCSMFSNNRSTVFLVELNKNLYKWETVSLTCRK